MYLLVKKAIRFGVIECKCLATRGNKEMYQIKYSTMAHLKLRGKIWLDSLKASRGNVIGQPLPGT